ncbi:MAG: hypothetical protein AAFY60_17220, partial [Myxococcota bacterium]
MHEDYVQSGEFADDVPRLLPHARCTTALVGDGKRAVALIDTLPATAARELVAYRNHVTQFGVPALGPIADPCFGYNLEWDLGDALPGCF